MQVTVECPCGQPYEFEVEPQNGRMPVEVQCPTCGIDGTEMANRFIANQPPALAAAPASSVRIRAVSATPPPHAFPSEMQNPAVPVQAARASVVSDSRTAIGILGAAGGGLVGMIAWYLLIKWTGYEIGYAAWGVGVLTGIGARMLARSGNRTLALVAGACAFVAIIGGQYLAVKSQFDGYLAGFIGEAYDKRMTFARAALKAGSDDELKTVLTSFSEEHGEEREARLITSDDLARFRTEEIPSLQAFAGGRPTKTEYEGMLRDQINSASVAAGIFKESMSLLTLLWLALGVGSAFRIAAQNE